jgi:hypothetical protein
MTKTPAADMLKAFKTLAESRMDWPVFLADDDDISGDKEDFFRTEILSVFTDDTDDGICLLLLDLSNPDNEATPSSALQFIEKLGPFVSDFPEFRVVASVLGNPGEKRIRYDLPIAGMAACRRTQRIYLGASGFRELFIGPDTDK